MQAFDKQTIDDLLFLDAVSDSPDKNNVLVLRNDALALSGDGILKFSRLIAAGLADYIMITNNAWQLVTYTVYLTAKGKQLVTDWKSGNQNALNNMGSFSSN